MSKPGNCLTNSITLLISGLLELAPYNLLQPTALRSLRSFRTAVELGVVYQNTNPLRISPQEVLFA